MMMPSTASPMDVLRAEVEALPDDLAAEVVDFILFVKARRDEDSFLWQQAEAAMARRAASRDEVHTVSADEWAALTAEPEG